MRIWSSLLTVLDFLFRRGRTEWEMEEELRSHLQCRAEDLERQGLSRAEADRQARVEFGGYQRYKEECREALGPRLLGELVADIRYALRQLRRNPGFTAVAIITLALGIGANSAIFSIIDSVFLRPLPYPRPAELVYPLWVWNGGSEDSLGSADYLFWKAQSHVFKLAGAYEPVSGSNLVVGEVAYYVHVTQVSPGLFATLGINPALGREFTRDEGQPNGPRSVILSYATWRRLFPAGQGTVGRTVRMNGKSYVVVGVLPRGFPFVAAADVYTPLQLAFNPNNHDQNYGMVARLRPGVTLEQAQSDTDRVFRLFQEMYPEAVWKGWRGLRLISYRQELTGNVRTPLLVLFGAVLLVLLIAIANVTSLFLGRAASRQTEIAVRAAIGASRGRLLRQLVTEGVLLGVLGGSLGLVVTAWSLKSLLAFMPHTVSIDLSTSLLPLGGQIKLSAGVLEFTFFISVLAGIAAGLFPYWQIRATNLYEDLKQGARNAASTVRNPRVRSGLVTAEIALAVILLAGAGLLTKSFLKLRTVNPGFNPQGLWELETSLPPGQYTTTEQAWTLQKRVTQRLETIPGVTGVATTSNLPVQRGLNFPANVPGCGGLTVQGRAISADYFRVMGIPLLTGREFRDTDRSSAVIINSALARRCWPGRSPLGMTAAGAQVVGVVGDTKDGALSSQALPAVYFPQWTVSDKFTRMVHGWFLTAWVIRSRRSLTPKEVNQAVGAVDPTLPVASFAPMSEFIGVSFAVAKSRFLAALPDGFAGLALLLAVIGIYGVLAYVVTQRAHEIGVRMALGAQKSDVLWMILGEGLRLTVVGLMAGLIGALVLTRLISSLLYDVKAMDPLTFVAISLLLIGVAVLACYIPARRAASIDPITALRQE